MKRTIELKNEDAYYRGKYLGYIADKIRRTFHITNSRTFKYAITIVEGTQYRIIAESDLYYQVRDTECNAFCGVICKRRFDKLFFVPRKNKRYDIIVKKVRKVKR